MALDEHEGSDHSEEEANPATPIDDPEILLRQLEADTTTTELHSQRARVFKRVAELRRAQGRDMEGQRAEWQSWLFDFMLVSRDERRSRGYGRFAPMIEMNGQAYPHVAVFPAESLLAFKDELDRSTNPIHRAMYSDFIWDQREKYLSPRKDAVEVARAAVDAYLQAAQQYRRNKWDDQLADALDRAAELAMSLRDSGRISLCVQECFRLADELIAEQQHPAVRWAIDLLETLQRFKRHLSPEDHQRIVSLVGAGASFCGTVGGYHIQRSFLGLLPESERALGRNDEAEDAIRRRAETFVAEAEQELSAVVRLHIFGEAVEAYQQLGDSEKIDELKRSLSQAGLDAMSEMTTVSAEVRVPAEVADAWVNKLLELSLEDALKVLATTKHFVPKIKQVRHEAAEQRRKHPLQYLVSRHTLDSVGRIVEKALTDEEQIAASEADVYRFELVMQDWELGRAFDRLESDRGLTAVTLMQFLRSHSIFETSTLDVVAVGVERYFAADYVSALHVLVPQLEDTFRDILAKLRISRTSARQGITREKPLDVVLSTPELRRGLGEDLATYFEWFLMHQELDNLRHRTAHGLLKLEHCTHELVHRILYCYLQLANLEVVAQEEPENGDAPTD
jgi:hypothetical protein